MTAKQEVQRIQLLAQGVSDLRRITSLIVNILNTKEPLRVDLYARQAVKILDSKSFMKLFGGSVAHSTLNTALSSVTSCPTSTQTRSQLFLCKTDIMELLLTAKNELLALVKEL